jgi:very-short-patch-repair endonuclease
MAAVLAYPGAVLSHRSAAALWGLLRQPDLVDVTLPGKAGHRHRRGIRVHHSLLLSPDQTTIRRNIPVTNPSRTLTDLRRSLPRPQFAAALRQAEFLRLPIDAAPEPDHTRSELETRFLALCRRHRLPQPEVNVRVGPFIADFLWSERRLIVEVDGYRAHGTPSAFERDRARDVELRLLGYQALRFTWAQVVDRPREVARALSLLLR